MANPKYADLPGIAHDQPDLYETNDLPEAEQGTLSTSDVLGDPCDSVEQLNVSADEAYNKFKGKSLDSKNVDFTDRIGPARKIGYDIIAAEWELVGDKLLEKETPLQAYTRLQFEVKQLFDNVSQIKESSAKESNCEIPPTVLAQKIEQVHKELQDLHMEKILGTKAIAEMSDPLGALHKKLLNELETFQITPVPNKKSKAATASVIGDSVKYELFVHPEQGKIETQKIANLEQRLKYLENVVGQDKCKWSFLTGNTDGKSVNTAVGLLSSKLSLLDPNYLDQVENRLVMVHQCMQHISEKKQQIDDAERQNKVVELYELAKKVDEVSTGLPQVVERLVALKELHEQALQFSKAVTQLDTTQQQITNGLKNNTKVLNEAKVSFENNREILREGVTSLNTRMEKLFKK